MTSSLWMPTMGTIEQQLVPQAAEEDEPSARDFKGLERWAWPSRRVWALGCLWGAERNNHPKALWQSKPHTSGWAAGMGGCSSGAPGPLLPQPHGWCLEDPPDCKDFSASLDLPPSVSIHTSHLLPVWCRCQSCSWWLRALLLAPKPIKGKTILGMCKTFRISRTFYSPSLGFLRHRIREMTRKTTAPHTTAIRMTRYRDKPVLWKSKVIQQRTFRQGSPPGDSSSSYMTFTMSLRTAAASPAWAHRAVSPQTLGTAALSGCRVTQHCVHLTKRAQLYRESISSCWGDWRCELGRIIALHIVK